MYMPGSDKGGNAAGYATTYDRARVVSAIAVAEMPIYNYNPGVGEKKNLATYVAFERDGFMTGWTGCSKGHATNWPHWQSTWGNGGPDLRPYLCQNGKYGYDPRCRGWYDTGMKRDSVYVTPPYYFASGRFAASATHSLLIPGTDNAIGQTLLDFLPNSFLEALDRTNTQIGSAKAGFPVVITSDEDVSVFLSCFEDMAAVIHILVLIRICLVIFLPPEPWPRCFGRPKLRPVK